MKWTLAIILLLLINACSEEKQKPKGVLDKEQFIEVLVDIQITDGHISYLYSKDDEAKIDYPPYYKRVFEQKGVTAKEFRKSYEFYSKDRVELYAIYEEVLDRINANAGANKAKNK